MDVARGLALETGGLFGAGCGQAPSSALPTGVRVIAQPFGARPPER